MGYSNSQLATYTRISPNRNSPRNHTIDRITPHCYVGQVSVESMAGWLCNPQAGASANYGIATSGRIGLFVEERDRSWCSSSKENDNRAVTIECASDVKYPYTITDATYNSLIELCIDICKRNGKKKLIWFGDKAKTLAYEPKSDEMVLSVHRWFANKECPGEYIYSRLGKIAETVTKALGGEAFVPDTPAADTYVVRQSFNNPETQTNSYNNLDYAKAEADRHPGYSVYVAATGECIYTSPSAVTKGYTPEEWIAMVAPIAQKLAKKNNILASVVIAQTALETGWGSTDLTSRFNIVGMKVDLINNTWKDYTTWPGGVYRKVTPEYKNGKLIYKEDDFRVYTSFEQCLEDYEQFLLHVQNDKGYKYRRVQGKTDPAEVINIICVGTGTNKNREGYMTDPDYDKKIMEIIKKYNLTRFDNTDEVVPQPEPEPVQQDTVKKESKTMLYYMDTYQKQLLADIKAKLFWEYWNTKESATFKGAVKNNNRRTNCARLVDWALRDLKVFDNTQYFYGDRGELKCSEGSLSALKAECDVIYIGGKKTVGKAIKENLLQPGDIVTYMDLTHTNVYAGNGYWYDAGHAYCKESGDGARFITWYGPTVYSDQKIAYIIRYRNGVTTKYRVQVGAYKKKANATKRKVEVKKQTQGVVHAGKVIKEGYDCFCETSGDGMTRVYCGSFKDYKEAELRLAEIKPMITGGAFITSV